MTIEVRPAHPEELSACLELRRRVFVEEQGVPEALEQDGLDPRCFHVVALEGGEIVGTARLRRLEDGRGKAERVCVAARGRGRGIGARLMAAIETRAHAGDMPTLMVAAQVPVVPFYARLGYVAEGQRFLEAGIEHLTMKKDLDT